uniref:Uncharacterized protein n=1 Tax=Tetranychus urticae TaxID=32264 RepID=T1L3R6_TETUR
MKHRRRILYNLTNSVGYVIGSSSLK